MIYDDQAVLEERDANTDTLLAHYRYADRLISLSAPDGDQFYHYSALRTTANLTDAAGNVKVSYRTDVWGEITDQAGESVNRQVFTGQEHDENTGLIYFGARFYDPDTARFITQDSYLGESGTPPSLHRYLYAYGNPNYWIDPDGHALYAFDGTGNDRHNPDMGSPTNVARLAKYYDGLVKYEAGVGTGYGNDTFALSGSIGGAGTDKRIERMYKSVVARYNGYDEFGKALSNGPDRDIDITGFSRGAAAARGLANVINERGIPDWTSARTITTGGRNKHKKTVYDRNFDSPDIRSLLLYDTVGSTGAAATLRDGKIAGDMSESIDLSIPANVKNVRHLIALNERRRLFPLTSAIDPRNQNDPRIVEMGCPGAHSDCGGGYTDDDSLARDGLAWMMNEGSKLGLSWKDVDSKDNPTAPNMAKPWKKKRHGGQMRLHKMVPQQGSRAMHNSDWGIDDVLNWRQGKRWEREVFYKKNPAPGMDDSAVLPYEVKSLPEHVNDNSIPHAYPEGSGTVE